jgi:hypothetical protein
MSLFQLIHFADTLSQDFHSGQLHRFNNKAQKQHDIQKFLGFLGVDVVLDVG